MTDFNFPSANSSGAQQVCELEEKIERYARVPHYVLITGERGTGKTTIAKRLHAKGTRAKNPFINLNCASLTPELLEAELFGYEKGAFTGAISAKAGLFEASSGGTLFLDEIGEIPLALQAKFLKAVEEKRVRRVGSNVERIIDTRIIAATSANLEQMIADGRFRADLFDRLNILRLETVPLKFQQAKIIELLTESLDNERRIIKRSAPFEISDEAVQMLLSYEWGGNFRELRNFAIRIAVECGDREIISAEAARKTLGIKIAPPKTAAQQRSETIAAGTVSGDFHSGSENLITLTIDPRTDDLDSVYLKAAGLLISRVLDENDGRVRQTARRLGTAHSTVTRLLTKFNAGRREIKQFPFSKPVAEQLAAAS